MPVGTHMAPAERERFIAAGEPHRIMKGSRIAERGRACGARTRTGAPCSRLALAGGRRCLRHAGPHAARAFHEAQAARLERGSLSPAQFARARERQARNALRWLWKRDPSRPGRSIDLGSEEPAFTEARADLGLRADALLPAVADWLRWRFQRTVVDRTDPAAWTRAVRTDLPARQRAADEAMVWVRLGGLDERTKAGRAVKAALRRGGFAMAEAEVLRQREEVELAARAAARRSGGGAAPKTALQPWRVRDEPLPGQRALPDRLGRKAPVGQLRQGMSRAVPTDPGEVARLRQLALLLNPELRRKLSAVPDDTDRLRVLANLSAVVARGARRQDQFRWMETKAFLRAA